MKIPSSAKSYLNQALKYAHTVGNGIKVTLKNWYMAVFKGLSYCVLLTGDGRNKMVTLNILGTNNKISLVTPIRRTAWIPVVEFRQRITLFKRFKTNR